MEATVMMVGPLPSVDRKVLQQAVPGLRVLAVTPSAGIAAQVREALPDVIVMEVDLRPEEGYAICRDLLAHRATRHIPIVWVSSTRSAQAPDADRIVSSDDIDTLAARITHAAAEAEILREVLRWTADAFTGAGSLTEAQTALLAEGGFSGTAELDPEPLLRGAREFDELRATSLTVAEAAARLGVTDGRVRQRLTATPPDLYGIRLGNEWRLPAFQFADEGLVPNVDRVITRVDRALNPVAFAHWLSRPNPELEREGEPVSPLAWLSGGGDWQRVGELVEDL